MLTFYCPNCWQSFRQDADRCPACGFDIRRSWDSRQYADKLIAALRHSDQETVIRVVCILGRRREVRAVEGLAALVRTTQDVYVTTAAVRALAQIGTPQALAFLQTIMNHPAQMVRKAVMAILKISHVEKTR
jgi:HEAT repeat protein